MTITRWDCTDYCYWIGTPNYLSKPSRTKEKQANILIILKWILLVQMWKFKNRKWTKCRQKNRALNRYVHNLMKGHYI